MNYTYQQQQQAQPPYSTTATRPAAYGANSGWNARVRPVSSFEEVRACPIDFDGSIFYFPDIANKRIYTKFINLDGTAAINMYEMKDMPPEEPMLNTQNFITREEFQQVIEQLKMTLQPPPVVKPQDEKVAAPTQQQYSVTQF